MFGIKVDQDAIAHAAAHAEKEVCGFVVNGQYYPLENVHEDAENHFKIDPKAWVKHSRIGEIQAIVHSHTGINGLFPSAYDMQKQAETGLPWGIVKADVGRVLWFGDHVLDRQLIGREFVPGVMDCYAMIRGYYHQAFKKKLVDFPRDAEWWENGGTLFVDGFKKAGFYAISKEQLQPGDVMLMQIRSKTPNHGAVILENGLMLHHVHGQLSRKEPFGRWLAYATHFLRYEDA